MIVLHAGLEDGRLLLWGESPAAPARTAPRPQVQSSATETVSLRSRRRRARRGRRGRAARRGQVADRSGTAIPLAADGARPSRSVERPRRRTAGAGRDGGPGAVAHRCVAPRPGADDRPARRLHRPGDLGPRRRRRRHAVPTRRGPCASPRPWRLANNSSPTYGKWGIVAGSLAAGAGGDDGAALPADGDAMPAACRALSRDAAAPPDQPAAGASWHLPGRDGRCPGARPPRPARPLRSPSPPGAVQACAGVRQPP